MRWTFKAMDEKRKEFNVDAARGSSSGKKRKHPDGERSDEAKIEDGPDTSTTEVWDEDTLRQFVSAIFDIGLRHSSPSVIMEHMNNRPPNLTSERIKSHLQKYRKNYKKSREDFLTEYDAFMQKVLRVGSAASGGGATVMDPSAVLDVMGCERLSGGDFAAFLSYSVMAQTAGGSAAQASFPYATRTGEGTNEFLSRFAGMAIPFPELTAEEKKSPLGISMVYVMGLFASMTQHIMKVRWENSSQPDRLPQQHIFEQQQTHRPQYLAENTFYHNLGEDTNEDTVVPGPNGNGNAWYETPTNAWAYLPHHASFEDRFHHDF